MARRQASLHHNLGDKNVVFHREHRSKKNRRPVSKNHMLKEKDFKRKKLAILIKELEHESTHYRG